MEAQATTVQEAPRPRSGPGRLSTLIVVAVTGAIILAVAFLANQPSSATSAGGGVTPVSLPGNATNAAPAIGQPAPDFTAQTADGKAFRLSDLKGQPVWLTFGASWCQACRAENPDIQATYDKVKASGVQVVQVYMAESAATVNDYAGRVGLTYLKVPDPDQRLADAYRILGIPTHYFIDSSGVLRAMKIGSLDPAAMEQALKGIQG
jgi:cytochrome c biogenesis protein CcmG/thiol:disulfide interchange protein DsbE